MTPFLLIIALLPYLYFSVIDNAYHFKLRGVSTFEHAIHLLIFITIGFVIYSAFANDLITFIVALALFAIFGSLDEFLFHKNLPEKESNIHAKAHWSLFIFVIVVLMIHHWKEININDYPYSDASMQEDKV